MPTLTTLASFTIATALLVAMPGPGMLFLLARGIGRGRRDALAAAVGVELSSLVFVAATAFGLTAIIASSAVALSVIRYVGAAYLVYLGVKALRSREGLRLDGDRAAPAGARRGLWDGFVVGITNPKVAVFFLAFFPQFIHPGAGPIPVQVGVLGAIFVAVGLAGDVFVATTAGSVGRWLRRRPRVAATHGPVTGVIYLLLGGATAA